VLLRPLQWTKIK